MKFYVEDTKYGGLQQKVLLASVKEWPDGTVRVIAYYTKHGYFEIYLVDMKEHTKRPASRVYVEDGINELQVMNTMIEIVEKQPHLLELKEFWR